MLEKLKNYFFKTCDKTGNIKGLKFDGKFWSYVLFPITGIIATIWVLIRVVPRPDRLRYPCMKFAIPISSSFLVFIGGFFTSMFSFNKIRSLLQKEKVNILFVSILSLVFIGGVGTTIIGFSEAGYSKPEANLQTIQQPSNETMGEGKGIFPGRVAWIHNSEATNEDLTYNDIQNGNGWFLDKNNNQEVIDEMLSQSIKEIASKNSISESWNNIFKYHNSQRGKGEVGYQSGEKIFIKVNRTSATDGSVDNDLSNNRTNYGISETSPQLVLSLLKQLVNEIGISQENIYVGDPMKHIYKNDYEMWSEKFPDVHYLDNNISEYGRELVEEGNSKIHYSDSGKVLRDGSWTNSADGDPVYEDNLYKIFQECEYLINLPTLKGHRRAGITMFAKNHFGSHTRSDAKHLHMGLVAPDEPGAIPENERHEYGMYRVLVDYMGYKQIREKSLIYIMDALYSAGHEFTLPTKWKSQPFNNDWSSSIFISQDQVAIESVGYDFLRHEYTEERHPGLTYPQMEGTDDYLHQAADSSNWPEDISYDPDNDGDPIPASLGVHEHWNNAQDKEYSRNMGEEEGIEFIKRDASNDTQDDTVIVHNTKNIPDIDGKADEVWENVEWQNIGQTWMPYDKFILSDDFTGKYKVLWSKEENKLYFLIEYSDDVLVDGYSKEDGASYYKYDIPEIFIDEDNSGGEHTYNENAFAYHMNVNYPEVGDTVHNFLAMDQAGEGNHVDYSDHFPEHVLRRKDDNKIVREFSLKVYDDSYDHSNPENSRVDLKDSKIMGLSVAYCDNDNPDEEPKERDHFFGSVEVAEEDSNEHWRNADHFGTAKLVDTSSQTSIASDMNNDSPAGYKLHDNYPNPFNPTTTIKYDVPKSSNVTISIYDIKGRKVETLIDKNHQAGNYQLKWNASNVSSGVYFYRITASNYTNVKKCMLIK